MVIQRIHEVSNNREGEKVGGGIEQHTASGWVVAGHFSEVGEVLHCRPDRSCQLESAARSHSRCYWYRGVAL